MDQWLKKEKQYLKKISKAIRIKKPKPKLMKKIEDEKSIEEENEEQKYFMLQINIYAKTDDKGNLKKN